MFVSGKTFPRIVMYAGKAGVTYVGAPEVLHLCRLRPYLQTLHKAGNSREEQTL